MSREIRLDKEQRTHELYEDVTRASRENVKYKKELKQEVPGFDNVIKVRSKLVKPANEIELRLVGLCDTVSSYTYLAHYNNPDLIPMTIGQKECKNIVQFTAQNDYRKHFPLTKIKKAREEGVGLEISFPGAHSNIGGAYPDQWEEKYHYLSILEPTVERSKGHIPNISLPEGKSLENLGKKDDVQIYAGGLLSMVNLPLGAITILRGITNKVISNNDVDRRREGEIPWSWWVQKGYYLGDQLLWRSALDPTKKVLKLKDAINEELSPNDWVMAERTRANDSAVNHHYQYVFLRCMKHIAEQLGNIVFDETKNEYYINAKNDFNNMLSKSSLLSNVNDQIFQYVDKIHNKKTNTHLEYKFKLSKEEEMEFYNKFICNSLFPVMTLSDKAYGKPRDGLDKSEKRGILPGIENEGTWKNQDDRGIPQRPLVK